jgi:hypothetical protein
VIDLSCKLNCHTKPWYIVRQGVFYGKTKLTVRVSRDLLERAKRYARAHDTTLTRLVSEYLRRLGAQYGPLSDAPAVGKLSGILSPDASVEDYRKHLENKYGSQT